MDLFSSPPPLAPPTSEEDKLSWLRLLRSRRVGATTFHRLMAETGGDARQALAKLPGLAHSAGLDSYAPCPEHVAMKELNDGRRIGARPVFHGEPDYPTALLDLPDAPPLLWTQGDIRLLAERAVALVGARNASSLGGRMARQLARELGKQGFVTVSGLARGIDRAVHEASLDSGTIAVVAGGVDVVYPQENADLTRQIAETGLIVSEQPPGLQPHARHFPQRNRIISGLVSAVLVVEAAAKSGSLITARNALDQGREVLAVPGHPFDARAAGCNLLIRDGATLVRDADDVKEALGSLYQGPTRAPPAPTRSGQDQAHRPQNVTALRTRILQMVGHAPVAEDQLSRDLNLPPQDLATELLALELDGSLTRQPGGLITRLN
ncbi:MAG: DNA-processing protein DprA [Pseudomonadota bacterium]